MGNHFDSMQMKSPISQNRVHAPNQKSPDDKYVPIAILNTFTQEWVIRVKVFKKYGLKHYSNQRGSGCIFNLDLIDK